MEKINYAIEMENITMIFNKTIVANKDINLKVKKGEIHALIGENGAGKSTLMSILFGIYNPTFGSIKINGKTEFIANPVKANKLGIGMVHQHFKLVDIFPLWKNIALGSEETKANIFVDKKEIKNKIEKIMNKYNLSIDLDQLAGNATVGSQQRAEILKILYREANILVFDEPTAVLTPKEIDGFLDVLLELKKAGKTIIFITHKMAEIKKVADTATVIRKGEYVGTYDVGKTSIDKLAEAMVGRKIEEIKNEHKTQTKEIVLKVEDLTVKKFSNNKVDGLINFNLEVKKGEIVAIAGVEGNGQQELVNAITGLQRPKEGKIFIYDQEISKESVKKRYEVYKIGHIPEDRHKHGLVLDNNLIENMVLQDIDKPEFSKYGFINFPSLQAHAQKIIQKYDVRNALSGFAIARQLSGGNQQKAIVGRELTRENNLIVIFQPTRGLDIGSIEFIHSQIIKAKEEGKAILLISYELNEILSLADRVVVLNSGKQIGQLSENQIQRDTIGKMMMGEHA